VTAACRDARAQMLEGSDGAADGPSHFPVPAFPSLWSIRNSQVIRFSGAAHDAERCWAPSSGRARAALDNERAALVPSAAAPYKRTCMHTWRHDAQAQRRTSAHLRTRARVQACSRVHKASIDVCRRTPRRVPGIYGPMGGQRPGPRLQGAGWQQSFVLSALYLPGYLCQLTLAPPCTSLREI
jgi:hypothetical protein